MVQQVDSWFAWDLLYLQHTILQSCYWVNHYLLFYEVDYPNLGLVFIPAELHSVCIDGILEYLNKMHIQQTTRICLGRVS